jgi:uncharacterized cupredoxin-like copper-binding protein
MKRFLPLAAIAFIAITLASMQAKKQTALAHDAHQHFSAGEPGDPKRPSKIVTVSMRESDGKMLFVPERLEIRQGEQVRFVLTNDGLLDHEFILATTEENLRHAQEMVHHPDMAHDEPNGKRLAPKQRGEIVWRFTRKGQFEYGCLIPGHREAGTTGIVIVK